MTTEQATNHTRRAVIGAALGGAAAVAAQSLAPLVARADTGNPALLGNANTADAVTSFQNTTDAATSLEGMHDAAGTGVFGTSIDGIGVLGTSTDTAPSDWTDTTSRRTGVYGIAGSDEAITWTTDEIGVYGFANVSPGSVGVMGDTIDGSGVVGYGDWGVYGSGNLGVFGDVDTTAGSVGVFGFTGSGAYPSLPTTAVGVWAAAGSTAGVALQVSGKVKFSRSGRVSIGSTSTSKKVTMTGVSTSSYVIATLQTSASGCYVRAVVCSSGYFTIYLSKAPGKTVYAGYMVIN